MIKVYEGVEPNEMKAREALAAQAERTEGILEYVAIMADIELPEGEGAEDEQVR